MINRNGAETPLERADEEVETRVSQIFETL